MVGKKEPNKRLLLCKIPADQFLVNALCVASFDLVTACRRSRRGVGSLVLLLATTVEGAGRRTQTKKFF